MSVITPLQAYRRGKPGRFLLRRSRCRCDGQAVGGGGARGVARQVHQRVACPVHHCMVADALQLHTPTQRQIAQQPRDRPLRAKRGRGEESGRVGRVGGGQ